MHSSTSGQVILSGQSCAQDDALSDPTYDQATAAAGGWRRMLGVPMLRECVPIGAIVVAWRGAGRNSGPAGGIAPDVRRPGGDRDRERAALQRAAGPQPRAHRGPRAADGDCRDPPRDQQLADRHPTGAGRGRRERSPAVRVSRCGHLSASTANAPADGPLRSDFCVGPWSTLPINREVSLWAEQCWIVGASTFTTFSAEAEELPEAHALAQKIGLPHGARPRRCSAKGIALGVISVRRTEAGLSPRSRSSCSKPSPTRR